MKALCVVVPSKEGVALVLAWDRINTTWCPLSSMYTQPSMPCKPRESSASATSRFEYPVIIAPESMRAWNGGSCLAIDVSRLSTVHE